MSIKELSTRLACATRWRRANAERGQSLVEMSVGFVILVTLVSGLLDLGRLWYVYIALEDAVGEVALYLSLDPFCLKTEDVRPDGTFCTDPNNGMYRAEIAVAPDLIDWTQVSTCLYFENALIGCDSGIPAWNMRPTVSVGDEVRVEMSVPVGMLTPIVPKFSGINPVTLTSQATQRVIRIYRPEDAGP